MRWNYNIRHQGLEFSTCHPSTSLDYTVRIFKAEDDLSCVGISCSPTDNVEEYAPGAPTQCALTARAFKARWRASLGTSYYALLYGKTQDSFGNYGVVLTSFDLPSNDLCEQSEMIEISETSNSRLIIGSTTNATKDDQVLLCEPIYPIHGLKVMMPGESLQHTGTCIGTVRQLTEML